MPVRTSRKSRRLEFRTSEAEYELLAEAAAEAGTSVSEFVRSLVVESARRLVEERRIVRISSQHAAEFYAALDDDTPVSQLQGLARQPTPDLA
jgi:uncharacterized protein (DUF1778 family)